MQRVEVVHIAGASSSGKRTLVKQLGNIWETQLRKRFGIAGSSDRFWDDDPGTRNKNYAHDQTHWEPTSNIFISTVDHALHKWQERSHKIIEQLHAKGVPQRVFLLWRPVDVMRDRNHNKAWWFPEIEEMRNNMRYILRMFEPVRQLRVPIEYVNAGTDLYDRMGEYPIS